MKEPKDMNDEELDAVVATEVLGWEYCEKLCRYVYGPTLKDTRGKREWHPSTSIADAWEVMDTMRAEGWHFLIEANTVPEVVVKVYRAGEESHYSPTRIVSAPRAICLAALAALSAVRAKEKV